MLAVVQKEEQQTTHRFALLHRTVYSFDRTVAVAPHEVRLRPLPDLHTQLVDYDLKVLPAGAETRWQQDSYGNFVARITFPHPTAQIEFESSFVVDLTQRNPFDFYLEPYALRPDFGYPIAMQQGLRPYLNIDPAPAELRRWLNGFRDFHGQGDTIAMLIELNRYLYKQVRYINRQEPGYQTPVDTLAKGNGSCRDTSWLLVNLLRHLGIAARFVSGYQLQLHGPHDQAELHAWAEAYLPGAGWIGFDPTSGLVTAEAHIAVAAGARPEDAAPVVGTTEVCAATLSYFCEVSRID